MHSRHVFYHKKSTRLFLLIDRRPRATVEKQQWCHFDNYFKGRMNSARSRIGPNHHICKILKVTTFIYNLFVLGISVWNFRLYNSNKYFVQIQGSILFISLEVCWKTEVVRNCKRIPMKCLWLIGMLLID